MPNQKDDALFKAAASFKDVPSIIKASHLNSTAKIMLVLEIVKRPGQEALFNNIEESYPNLLRVTRLESASAQMEKQLKTSASHFQTTEATITTLLGKLYDKKPESYDTHFKEFENLRKGRLDPLGETRSKLESNLADYVTKKEKVADEVIKALSKDGKPPADIETMLDELYTAQQGLEKRIESLVKDEDKARTELEHLHVLVYKALERQEPDLAPKSLQERTTPTKSE